MQKTKKYIKILLPLIIIIWYAFFALPSKLFDKSTSTVIFDSSGKLIGARLATDEQWRFAQADSVPYKFEQCILNFEDEYFYYHPGFNPISIYNALVQNIKTGRVKRGGSTITMQTIRLSRGNRSRNIYQKIVVIY